MPTNRDIVTRAHRKLNISGQGEQLDGDMAVEGMEALNGMLHEWKLRAVDIEHSDLGLDDDFPIGPEFIDGTVYMLAGRISPNYTRPQSFDADDFFRAIQAAYMVIEPVTFDTTLTLFPSQIDGRFD